MISQLNNSIPTSEQISTHFPKSVRFNGKSIQLASDKDCLKAYRCSPRDVLYRNGLWFTVVGMGKAVRELWIKQTLGKEAYPVEGAENYAGLKRKGFKVIKTPDKVKSKKRKREAIDNSQDCVCPAHKIFRTQCERSAFHELEANKAKFEAIISSSPNDRSALRSLAQTLTKLRELNEAKTKLDLEPQNVNFLANYAEILREMGYLTAAKLLFQEALNLNSEDIFALGGYAETLRQLGELDAAQSKFKEMIALSPQNIFALRGLANTLYDMGHLNEAKASFEDILAIYPEDGLTFISYGAIFRDLGQPYIAEDQFKKALVLLPRNNLALSCYADILRILGRLCEAKIKFEEALYYKPNNAFTLRGYADTMRLLGLLYVDKIKIAYLKVAKIKFEEALNLDSKNLFALNYYATTLFELGEVNAAIAKFEEILSLYPYDTFAKSKLHEIASKMHQANLDTFSNQGSAYIRSG